MALESATYIAQLNNANPSSTDVVSQADDHLRLIKSVLKNTFPNLDQPVSATPAQLNQPIPSGLISLWSGSIVSIPTGWVLCDGTNSTPDLRNRFVVGAGDTYAVGATGGAASQTLITANLPAHTHTVTVTGTTDSGGSHNHSISDPGHSHTWGLYVSGVGFASGNAWQGQNGGGSYSTTTSSSGTGISINSGGAHTHTFSGTGTTSSVGSGTAFSILPPYYALAYIMKT